MPAVWRFSRRHSVPSVPSGLWLFDFSPLGNRSPSSTTSASFSSGRSLMPAHPALPECQLIPQQLQSTKRERMGSWENSHQSHRGRVAQWGQAVGRTFFLLPSLPTFCGSRSDTHGYHRSGCLPNAFTGIIKEPAPRPWVRLLGMLLPFFDERIWFLVLAASLQTMLPPEASGFCCFTLCWPVSLLSLKPSTLEKGRGS